MSSLELKSNVEPGRQSFDRKRRRVPPVERRICCVNGREDFEQDCARSDDGPDEGVRYESHFEAAVERIVRSIDLDLWDL